MHVFIGEKNGISIHLFYQTFVHIKTNHHHDFNEAA
jgi:hypothetical protein